MVKQNKYTPIIIQNEAGFCVYLPGKGISGEGATLDDAYKEYLGNLTDNEKRAERYSLATITQDPYPIIKHRDVVRELITFWLKAVSAFIIVIIVLVLLLPNIRAAAEYQISESARFVAFDLPQILITKIDKLKPEEEAKISAEWGQVIKKTSSILIDDRKAKQEY